MTGLSGPATSHVRAVDYDDIAGDYPRRYERHDYRGIEQAVVAFVSRASAGSVLEVGCGTGHWLAVVGPRVGVAIGIDPSQAMLAQVRTGAPAANGVRGRAEDLPFAAASVDRVMCVNALHHFADPRRFIGEARRVLRARGGLLTIGLDPHVGTDRWWIYDYFPEALAADRVRYLPTAEIRRLMAAAGFVACETFEAQHVPAAVTVREAVERGLLERSSASQLMVIGDGAYRAGLERIRAAEGVTGGEEPMLRADLRLYATVGWIPAIP